MTNLEYAYEKALLFQLNYKSAQSMHSMMDYKPALVSIDFVDILAEKSVNMIQDTAARSEQNIRLRNSLYSYGNHRYDTTLKEIIKVPGFESGSVSRFLKKGDKEPQYYPGTIDLERYKEETISNILSTPPINNGFEIISKLKEKDSIAIVFERLGNPDTVSLYRDRLSFFYKDAGAVVIGRRKNKFTVEEVKPNKTAYEYMMPYFNKKDVSDPMTRSIILYGLAQGDTLTLRNLASALYKQKNVDIELHDIFASILDSSYKKSLTPLEEDASAWIIKLLSTGYSPRYKKLIAKVSLEEKNKKLRDYSKKYAQYYDGNNEGLGVFESETINMDNFRLKHLNPYRSIVTSDNKAL